MNSDAEPDPGPGWGGLDLASVLARGWAEPGAMSLEGLARAVAFHSRVRAGDAELGAQQRRAAAWLARACPGCPIEDIGSFGVRLNLPGSDLDLGIAPASGTTVEELVERLRAAGLRVGATETSRFGTPRRPTRHDPGHPDLDPARVDVSVLAHEHLAAAAAMRRAVNSALTAPERSVYTWVKARLRADPRHDADYQRWKLAPYARCCPHLLRTAPPTDPVF